MTNLTQKIKTKRKLPTLMSSSTTTDNNKEEDYVAQLKRSYCSANNPIYSFLPRLRKNGYININVLTGMYHDFHLKLVGFIV